MELEGGGEPFSRKVPLPPPNLPPSLPKTFDLIESLLQGVRTEKGFPLLGKLFFILKKKEDGS